MNWLDLYNFLHEQANCSKNIGKFPWQETVKVWDWDTLDYYPADFIEVSENNISFCIDTYQNLETVNDTGN
jgi:hypothetical protein